MLKIRSYPYEIAGFCLVALISTIYAMFSGAFDAVGYVVGIVVPLVFLFLLEYVSAVFDVNKKTISVLHFKLLKSEKLTLSFDEVLEVKKISGKGRYAHRGYLILETESGAIKITSMGAFSGKVLAKKMSEARSVLGYAM